MSNITEKYISPIAIDLGAKNTGVYFAHYRAEGALDEIKNKKGKVYQLEKDKYTLLMENRTATRHQKRGFDRRQMVKRLFKLIWTKHFELDWNKDIQQAISFLLNRRGFTFLTEEYDSEVLKEFPSEILNHNDFPTELKKKLSTNDLSSEPVNLHEKIQELSKNSKDLEKVKELFDKEIKKITRPLCVIGRIEKLKKYCEKRKKDIGQKIEEGKKEKGKLSELSHWILKEWKDRGIKGLEINNRKQKSVDIVSYLNDLPLEKIKEILTSIPDTAQEKKKLKNSIWKIQKVENFKLESADFSKPKEENKLEQWRQTHLQHLGFALDKTYNEIKSGGRHRSKYFEEIEKVLNDNYTEKSPKYLKNFCDNLKAGEYPPLDIKTLKNLIGHLSNFELNLLRSYFNCKSHIEGDKWNETRLDDKLKHWVKNIWRVNPEKDKEKADEGKYSYKCLKNKLEKNKNIINFFLKEDPNWTIPPYQNKDNRHPPKCQSLILNTNYLDQHYKDWESWLDKLKEGLKKEGSDYLGDYEKELNSLTSARGKGYFNQKIESNLKKDSGKRTKKHLKARLLQFIFDRVKKEDPFKLNHIFSHTKKLRQIRQNIKDNESVEAEKEKLEKSISNSKLPTSLKSEPDFNSEDIFKQKTFLHLVCKYYKLRQKAKDSRLFIHPMYNYVKGQGYKNTGRFYDKKQLLIYCNHKPRRKEHQTFDDLAPILKVSSKKLREKAENSDDLIKKLKDIKGLKTNCDALAKQQKKRRNFLKSHINTIYYEIDKAKKESIKTVLNSNELGKNIKTNANLLKKKEEKLIKNTLTKLTQIKDAKNLYDLCEKAKKLYKEILTKLDLLDDKKTEVLNKNLENPAFAFYSLAQINNIAFKERSGNASACPVCSRDNSERMQISDESQSAKASRLPAIPTRIIDGAIMRMTRIITKAITDEKWKDIESHLKNNEKVHIPIVTESNQFEFEPSREELVRKQRNRTREGKVLDRKEGFHLFESQFKEKEDRIKVNKNCPYPLGGEISEGEIDHIIPRKSKHGTLNDEANLIWASIEGNKEKDKTEYNLSELKPSYKEEIFGNKKDPEIIKWIKETIWNEETQDFKFGNYINFMNLKSEEQKAFRHALFLKGDPLREKVIRAIDNRNRSFVNGTQRYFAEVLANEIYKKAKKEKLEHLLSFDYFSSPAQEIYEIRENMKHKKNGQGLLYPELKKYQKTNKPQKSYSHLIDAQVAFISALSKHYNEGSFKIKSDDINIYEDYQKIKILDKNLKVENLERKAIKPLGDQKISHRSIFNSNAGAWHFLKLIEIKVNNSSYYLKGFLDLKKLSTCLEERDWSKIELKIESSYCYERTYNKNKSNNEKKDKKISIAQLLNNKEKETLVKLYQIGDGRHQFGYQKNKKYPKMILEKKWDSHSNNNNSVNNIKVFLHQINKTKVAEFLLENFNTKSDSSQWKEEDCQVLDHLKKIWYHTKKKSIEENNLKQTLEKKNNFKMQGLFNPSLFYSWNKLNKDWISSKDNLGDFDKFLKEYFKDKTSKHDHKKVRKNFSLPLSSSGQGWFLVKRKAWNKDKNPTIYQCLSEENISKYGSHKETLKAILYPHFRQRNLFLFPKSNKKSKHLKETLDTVNNIIPPDKYYKRDIPDDFKDMLEKIENKTSQDSKRAYFRFQFKHSPKLDSDFIKIIKEFPTRIIYDLNKKLEKDSDHSMNEQKTDSHKKENREILFNGLEKTDDIQSYIETKIEKTTQKTESNKRKGNQKTKEENKKLTNEQKFYSEIKNLYNKVNENILEYQTVKPFKKE